MMTVEIEFLPDQHEADLAEATDPVELFGETLLLVRVRFRVDGQDMIPPIRASVDRWVIDEAGVAARSEPMSEEIWRQQPLIGLLTRLERAVREASSTGASHCYLIESADLTFVRRGGSSLAVTSPDRTRTATAAVDEFTEALATFRGAARSWLAEAAPHLAAHPSWVDWFQPV
jgi:hypothetical protein